MHPVAGPAPDDGVPDAMRSESRGQRQADLPAEQSAARTCARFQAADAHPGGAGGREQSASQGPADADGLTRAKMAPTVLAARYRMKRSADFSATVKHGVRAVQPDIVVHVRRTADGEAGPRIGLVVGKSVGSAVERHRVARRLRHVARGVANELDGGDHMVIRALPGSRHAISARLERQLRVALVRAGVLGGVDA